MVLWVISGNVGATLGLAGVALQVGVKSAIASLWSVTDQSTSELVKTCTTRRKSKGTHNYASLKQIGGCIFAG
ncbi:CHAT domain-containing protein [Nostoc sp.]|uniref:CHAT domain-containing protein n=1 Tax=Nostoc sp. TaxID=1180 RepID=UPI002FF972BD